MDIKNRVLSNQPTDFFHRLASIVPGYEGYVDREKRRDADRLLRIELAHKYTAQRDRLNRAEQALLRQGQLAHISDVDRLVGNLQRFIDRLSTATYGYAGLFAPIKVEAPELDQIYAFDMALSDGVDKVSSATDTLEAAVSDGAQLAELPAAVGRLSGVIDDLNARFSQRADLLTSGTPLADDEYRALVSSLTKPEGEAPAAQAPQQAAPYVAPAAPAYTPPDAPYTPPGGEYVPPQPDYTYTQGTPTTDLGMPPPGLAGGSHGIETASSPTMAENPDLPGHDISPDMGRASGVDAADMVPDATTDTEPPIGKHEQS
jgi:hypothetical protein